MAASTAVLAGLVGAGAQAQDVEDPMITGEREVAELGERGVPLTDSDLTPRAKDASKRWRLVSGARFPGVSGSDGTDLAEGSFTSYDDNLFAVSFRNTRQGLVGGARCENSDPDGESGCRPVVYRYEDDASKGEQKWRAVPLPGGIGDPGGDAKPGYVGAIAWIDNERALVVGGTGRYPRREPEFAGCGPAPAPSEPFGVSCDPAGEARAWLMEADGSWCELQRGRATDDCPALPEGRNGEALRGLTAVDFKHDSEVGFIGGLGQMYRWRDGAFDRLYDGESGTDDVAPAPGSSGGGATFRYRVRQIRFVPVPEIFAFAVTSGCCDDQGERPGVVMTFRQTVPGSPTATPDADGGWTMAIGPSGPGQPLSLYSVVPWVGNNPLAPPGNFLLRSTARAGQLTEPRSVTAGSGSGVSSARFVSIDGLAPWEVRGPSSFPNAPGWAVGELRSQRAEGRGRRGLVNMPRNVSRTPPSTDTPRDPNGLPVGPISFVGGAVTVTQEWSDYANSQIDNPRAPTDVERLERSRASLDFYVDSYSLNAVEVVGDSGAGYAVGDHGAVNVLEAEELPEPDAPRVGSANPAPLSNRTPLDSSRPRPAGRVGRLPALMERPREQLAEPRMEPYGSPDAKHAPRLDRDTEDVRRIVMSRDGSEGWAIGPHHPILTTRVEAPAYDSGGGYGALSLAHYRDGAWRRCDPKGVRGELAPDRACASLARLRDYMDWQGSRVKLISAARVPLEKDDIEGNDDDFEVIAVGSPYEKADGLTPGDPTLLRYRNGVWDFEPVERRRAVTRSGLSSTIHPKDIVFTAPDDGWLLARDSTGVHRLFHYDGTSWIACTRAAEGCAGPRFPGSMNEATLRMTAAGDRVYLYGSRASASARSSSNDPIHALNNFFGNRAVKPLILYRERRGSTWTDGSGEGESGGGLDRGCGSFVEGACQAAPDAVQGHVFALAVSQRDDGRYEGFAVGQFSYGNLPPNTGPAPENAQPVRPDAPLLRLKSDQDRERWELFKDPGALGDYVVPPRVPANRGWPDGGKVAMFGGSGEEPVRALVGEGKGRRVFSWSPERGRFEMPAVDRPPELGRLAGAGDATHGEVQTVASDGEGGAWVAVKNLSYLSWSHGGEVYLYRYTRRPHRAVFEDSAHPFGARPVAFTALAGARDGGVWVGTDSGVLGRYDRLGGWETVSIPGWNVGRIVTREAAVRAVSVNASGVGVAVGEGGRIADLDHAGVTLDAASGRRCRDVGAEPCGAGWDLHAAAVAPDGSALVGGDSLVMLGRSAGGRFRAVSRPPGGAGARITGISMPVPDRAWAVSNSGHVYAGELSGGGWSWRTENLVGRGEVLGGETPLAAVAVEKRGDEFEGYAVGSRGLVLRRVDGRWKRIRPPGTDDLTSVTMPAGGGSVAIGGRNGLVLTGERDDLHVTRHADYSRMRDNDQPSRGPQTGPVVGLALLPGVEDGQLEAWAAIQARGAGTNRLLHYASSQEEPLLDPARRVEPLPDAPAKRPGEISFAAFGKSDCSGPTNSFCHEMSGSNEIGELTARRVAGEVKDRVARDGGFAVFTGDAADSAGLPSNSTTPLDEVAPGPFLSHSFWGRLKHRRWSEFVAGPIEEGGRALFGAIGAGDLSRPATDLAGSGSPAESAKTGENLAWRQAMGGRAAPWGDADADGGSLRFSETPGSSSTAQRIPDVIADPDDAAGPLPRAEVRGGARTHYAAEVERDDERVARLIVMDTSLRSLAAGDPVQQPVEVKGQLEWLERMLCFEGDIVAGARCTREPGQQAIVVSNTPTYSYGPGVADATQHDGSVTERLLLRYRASVVVSGRLGWNGRYWATAPGVHEPCPGEGYRDTPPQPGRRVCGEGADAAPDPPPAAAGGLAKALDSVGAPPPPEVDAEGAVDRVAGTATGVLPFVVASGGGGRFGPNGDEQNGSAADGYWHGHSVVRLDPSGDPRGVIVEQRPVFDWVSLTAQEHVLRPGQRMRLRGVGRQPIGLDISDKLGTPTTRFATINSAAITHRYDLLEADPDRPYLARKDADGNPVQLSPDIATVDAETGSVRAGRGNHPRAFAIAVLSVGEKAASWPIVFEPRKSFRPEPPARLAAPALPRPAPAIRTLAAQPSIPPQPPPAGVPPTGATPSFPPTPALPAPPPPFSGATPAPPVPPAPPPPPPPQLPSALDLLASPPSVPLAPQATVIPPPAPPIQPAPPGGARREARQRQAAVQKGEEGGGDPQKEGVDMAEGPATPDQTAMTRREPGTEHHNAFTALDKDRRERGSPALLYGGGLTLAALLLAIGWQTGRPDPRRRPPQVPAPAWARRPRR